MTNETIWHKYLNKLVLIQLRNQPYIAISGEEHAPVMQGEGELLTTPLLAGVVVGVNGTWITVECPDPDPAKSDCKAKIALQAERDIGYITEIERNRVIA